MIHTPKQIIHRILAGLAARFAEPATAGPTQANPTTSHSSPFEPILLPPAGDVSPEEAMDMWDSPPVVLAKKRAIIKVQPDGLLPEALEQIHLTSVGKVLARADFIIEDDFGVQGKTGESPRQCQFCKRYAFYAQPCVCGLIACPSCGAPTLVEGQAIFLCKQCERKVKWQQENW